MIFFIRGTLNDVQCFHKLSYNIWYSFRYPNYRLFTDCAFRCELQFNHDFMAHGNF